MILITGGSFQGKKDWAKEAFQLKDDDFFTCSEGTELDFSKKAVEHLEAFVLGCIREGKDALTFFEEKKEAFQDKILIGDDIFSGVVPMEKENRMWREEAGRLYVSLSKEASEVYRVFLGIGKRLK